MAKKTKFGNSCCGMQPGMGCKIESLVTVDERGQMVLPKEVRQKAGIRAGEKLALITWGKDGQVQCLAFIKVNNLTEMIKGLLGPMAQEILQTKESPK